MPLSLALLQNVIRAIASRYDETKENRKKHAANMIKI